MKQTFIPVPSLSRPYSQKSVIRKHVKCSKQRAPLRSKNHPLSGMAESGGSPARSGDQRGEEKTRPCSSWRNSLEPLARDLVWSIVSNDRAHLHGEFRDSRTATDARQRTDPEFHFGHHFENDHGRGGIL